MRLIDADRIFDELSEILREPITVYGYDLNDLLVFATACKQAGITSDGLKDFKLDYETIYAMATSVYKRHLNETINDILNRSSGGLEDDE